MAALDSTDSNTYSVRTLGLRAADADSAEVAARVKQRFKVDEARALMVLNGQVVARNLPIERARALKTVLFEIGLLAKVQKTGSAAEREVSDTEPPSFDVDVFLAGLDRSSSGVEPDRKYRTLAVFMLVGAVVAPALYLAAIVGIAAGMWTYVEHVTIGESLGGVLLYVTPLLIGLTVEIFLVRPLFLGVELPTRMPIAESDAPNLYQLVRRMSIATNTPEPENIYLDALPNASVSSCAGAKGILQKRLELTVGMPLAYGMSAAELASVIAHGA